MTVRELARDEPVPKSKQNSDFRLRSGQLRVSLDLDRVVLDDGDLGLHVVAVRRNALAVVKEPVLIFVLSRLLLDSCFLGEVAPSSGKCNIQKAKAFCSSNQNNDNCGPGGTRNAAVDISGV